MSSYVPIVLTPPPLVRTSLIDAPLALNQSRVAEHVLRKIHHISIEIAELQFLNDLFYQNISIYPAKFPNDLFVTAQTAFHHRTFRFITAHFVHHCTFKQALKSGLVFYRD